MRRSSFSFPYLRANLLAPSLASAPELQKKTRSSDELSTMVSCEIELWGGVEEVAHLEDEARLLSNRLGDRGVRVAEIEHRPSGREVEVRLAVVIEHPAALAPHQHRRHAAHDLHVVLGFLGFVFGGSGHLSGPDESAAVRSAHGVFNN